MKNLTQQQYTDKLINKYYLVNPHFSWTIRDAKECAKIDVQNTIDTVLDIALQSKQHRLYKYFAEVLTILNEMK